MTLSLGSDIAKAAVAYGLLSVNYHQYGAVGDGVADDSPSIQAAMNAAAALGLPLAPKAGTYAMASTVVIPAGLHHIAGSGCVYKCASANPMLINGEVGGTYTGYASANSDITMIGGTFDANSVNTTCLALCKGDRIRVSGVSMKDVTAAHFIELNSCRYSSVKGCHFEGMTDTDGSRSFSEAVSLDFLSDTAQFPYFSVASVDDTVCSDIEVSGNSFADCLVSIGSHGYTTYGDGTTATMLRRIRVFGNGHIGNGANTTGPQASAIHADGWLGFTVSDETIEAPGNNGVSVDESMAGTVSNITVIGAANHGVYIAGDAIDCEDIKVSNVTLRGGGDVVKVVKAERVSVVGCGGLSLVNGVTFDTCDDCSVTAGTFEACSGNGIRAINSNNRLVVSGNNVRNTGEACIDIAANNGAISGNSLSLPASSKPNIRLSGGSGMQVSDNFGNGASLSEHIKVAGAYHTLRGNLFFGTATAALVIDSGADNILYDGNRFAGSGTAITDNGSNSVVGTNFTT